MASELQLEQRELAEFIRAGSTHGHQCFGSYFDEKGGSCALGAVYEGVYHLPRHHGKLMPDHLERLFRCLDEVVKRCPQGCNKRLPLAPMIVHLNDDHRMTREQIAEWLAQEETRKRIGSSTIDPASISDRPATGHLVTNDDVAGRRVGRMCGTGR